MTLAIKPFNHNVNSQILNCKSGALQLIFCEISLFLGSGNPLRGFEEESLIGESSVDP